MKKCVSLAMTLIIVISSTGCWDYTEYENMALVRTIGFDINEVGNFVLTIEYVKSENKDPSQMQGGGQTGETRSAAAKTVAEAFDNVQKELQYEMFLGYTTIIIISEEIGKQKMEDIIDFLHITPDIRKSVGVVSFDGKARDVIIGFEKPGRLVGDQIQDFIYSLPRTGIAFPVRLGQYLKMILISGAEPVLPRIKISEEGYIKMSGMIVFKGFEIVGVLSENEARGWGIIEGKGVHPLVTIYPIMPGQEKSMMLELKIRESKTKIKVKIQDGLPVVYISVKTYAGAQAYSHFKKKITQDVLNVWQQYLEAYIKNDIEAAISKAKRELNSDVFGIGLKVYQQHRKEWKGNYEGKWDEIFSDIPVHVEVYATIQSTGMLFNPPVEK